MRSALKVFSAGFLSLALCGCGDNNGTITAPGTGNGSLGSSTTVSVAITPTATATIDAGQTVAFAASLTGDSGNKGVSWTVTAGAGTLASPTGLTNTYTAPATAVSFVKVTATSVLDPTKSASAAVTVNPLPSFTSTGQLPAAFAGVAYSTTLASTGGTGTRTYALTGGTLPSGLTLNATTGVISGTPTASGSSTFSLSVTDSAATPTTATASFTLGVSALQIVAPTLTPTVVGRTYTTGTYTAAYAQGAVTFAVTSGTLPSGITLSSTGVVSGTATTAGDSAFTITAKDTSGQAATITGAIHVAGALQFSGATLPSTQAGDAFARYTMAATGGTASYTYNLAAGSALPAGITLSTGGVLAGTPTTPGSYTFTIVAADSAGAVTTSSQTATATFTLVVTVPPLAFTTTSLAKAVIGSPYLQTIVATGGVAPYVFTVTSGTLPAGIYFSIGGQFTGRSSAGGTYPITVQVTDSESTPQVVSQMFTLTLASTLTPGAGNAMLNGSYAFVFNGVGNGALAAGAASTGSVFGSDMAGSLTFDGTSLVTGTIDRNDSRFGFQGAVAATGSYTVGSDRRGQVVLDYGGKTITLDVAVYALNSGVATGFRFIEADADNAVNVDQVQGSGEAVQQTSSAFTTASLTGGYVFRLSGETPDSGTTIAATTGTGLAQFGALSAAGYIQLDGAGLIVRGTMDASSYNTAYPLISLTGSYTAPDIYGRGTMVINTVGTGYPVAPVNFVYYVIGARQIVLLSADSHLTTSLMAGMAHQQQQTLYTASSLSGTVIGSESAVQGGNGNSTFPSILSATFYVLKVTGIGTMSAYSASNTNGVTEAFASPDPLTYTVSDTGRVTLVDLATPAAQLPVFWLYDTNKGVGTEFENTTGPIGSLQLEGQTAGNYTAASISGTYTTGVTPSIAPLAFTSGVLTASTGSTGQLTQDVSSNGNLITGAVLPVNKAVEAGTGRFTLTGTNLFLDGYVLSPSKLVFFDAMGGSTKPVIRFAEK